MCSSNKIDFSTFPHTQLHDKDLACYDTYKKYHPGSMYIGFTNHSTTFISSESRVEVIAYTRDLKVRFKAKGFIAKYGNDEQLLLCLEVDVGVPRNLSKTLFRISNSPDLFTGVPFARCKRHGYYPIIKINPF